MSYKIVFFDIDGTLVNEEKQIPDSTKEAIDKLHQKNVEVAIATGRSPFHLEHIAKQLGITSYVCYNGSYVVYKGEVLHKAPIEKDHLQTLIHHAAERNHALVFSSSHASFSNSEEHQKVLESFYSLKVAAPGYNPNYWQEDEILQAMVYCEEHEESDYHKIDSLSFVRWHKYSMDVIPKGGSKAIGVGKMLQHLNLTAAEAVAFGDGLNDREMLSFVGMGVAMGNSHEKVKPCAKFTTKHVDEDGIWHGLKQLELI